MSRLPSRTRPAALALMGAVAALAGGSGVLAAPASAAITEARAQMSVGEAGESSDIPLIGDWNGDGVETVGLVRPFTRQFGLKDVNDRDTPTSVTVGGNPGDIPVVGRWNAASERDIVALFRPSNGVLYYPTGTGPLDGALLTGAQPGDLPLAGDWNADGIDTFGLWTPSTRSAVGWRTNQGAITDPIAIGAGDPGDLPVIGDWNADGVDTLAVYRPSSTMAGIYYGTDPGGPAANPAGVPFGNPGGVPVVGDFDGDGSDGLGIFHRDTNTFYLSDSNKAPVRKPGPPTLVPAPAPKPGGNGISEGGGPVAPGGVAGRITLAAKKGRVDTSYGAKPKIKGTLTDDLGRGISGATLDVFERVATAGAERAKVGSVTTGAGGAFTYVPATKASRSVEFAWASQAGSADYSARGVVELRVKAGVAFSLDRKKARRGALVRFTGKVRVDPLPTKGLRVVIESGSSKRWTTGALLRVRPDGTFRWSYRFKNAKRFRFRARVLSSDRLPARTNSSVVRTIRIS